MKKRLRHYYIASMFILSASMHVDGIGMEQSRLEDLHAKYSVAPQEKCLESGCKNKEECFYMYTSSISSSTHDISELKRKLTADANILNQELQKLSNYWFWPEDPARLHLITSYLANLQATEKFLMDSDVIVRDGQKYIASYHNLPTDEQALQAVILKDMSTSNSPFQGYNDRCKKILLEISSWSNQHAQDFPTIAQELTVTQDRIGQLLATIYPKALEEERIQQEKQRIIIEQAYQKDALQAKAKEHEAEQRKIKVLQDLYHSLKSVPWNSIHHMQESSLEKLQQTINALEYQAHLLNVESSTLHATLHTYQMNLNDALKYRTKRDKLDRITTDNNNKQDENNLLQKLVDSKRNQLSKLHPPTAQEQHDVDVRIKKGLQELQSLDESHKKRATEREQLERTIKTCLEYKDQLYEQEALQASIEQRAQELNKKNLVTAPELEELLYLNQQLENIELKNRPLRALLAKLIQQNKNNSKNS